MLTARSSAHLGSRAPAEDASPVLPAVTQPVAGRGCGVSCTGSTGVVLGFLSPMWPVLLSGLRACSLLRCQIRLNFTRFIFQSGHRSLYKLPGTCLIVGTTAGSGGGPDGCQVRTKGPFGPVTAGLGDGGEVFSSGQTCWEHSLVQYTLSTLTMCQALF